MILGFETGFVQGIVKYHRKGCFARLEELQALNGACQVVGHGKIACVYFSKNTIQDTIQVAVSYLYGRLVLSLRLSSEERTAVDAAQFFGKLCGGSSLKT
jgi:hypothetical protein